MHLSDLNNSANFRHECWVVPTFSSKIINILQFSRRFVLKLDFFWSEFQKMCRQFFKIVKIPNIWRNILYLLFLILKSFDSRRVSISFSKPRAIPPRIIGKLVTKKAPDTRKQCRIVACLSNYVKYKWYVCKYCRLLHDALLLVGHLREERLEQKKATAACNDAGGLARHRPRTYEKSEEKMKLRCFEDGRCLVSSFVGSGADPSCSY